MRRQRSLKEPDENGNFAAAETKADKFRRLRERRVRNALKAIKYVRNLASKASYDYTPEQAEELCQMLADAVTRTIETFQAKEQDSEELSFTT